MGQFALYKCNSCNKTVKLGGPQEFKKTLIGNIIVRHAGNGFKRNINGLYVNLWCPKCAKVKRKILTTFKKRITPLELWGGNVDIPPVKTEFHCKSCNTSLIGFIPDETTCKKCKRGKLEFQHTLNT